MTQTMSAAARHLTVQRAQGYHLQAVRLERAASRAWKDGEAEASQWLSEQSSMLMARANELYSEAGVVVSP